MNLNDRRQSEKKEPEQSKKKAEETKNLNSTSQSSTIISKQKEVIESQQKKIAIQNQMIEDLKKQNQDQAMIIEEKDETIQEQQKEMSESSSIISTLKNELQKKSEQIEKLNSADLILKDNERLKEEIEKSKKSEGRTKRDCEIKLSTYGAELIDKKNQAVDLIIHLKEEESAFKERELNMDNEILIKATELTDVAELEMQKEYDAKVEKIKQEYDSKKYAIYAVTIGAIIYGFVVTVLKLLSSERMRNDLFVIFKNIYTFFREAVEANFYIISDAWSLTNHQDNRAGWITLAVFLIILVIVIQLAIAAVVSGAVLVFIFWAYSDGKFDFPMVITMLVSMILIVWVADKMTFVSLNLVLVWLLVQFFVIVGRGIFENIS